MPGLDCRVSHWRRRHKPRVPPWEWSMRRWHDAVTFELSRAVGYSRFVRATATRVEDAASGGPSPTPLGWCSPPAAGPPLCARRPARGSSPQGRPPPARVGCGIRSIPETTGVVELQVFAQCGIVIAGRSCHRHGRNPSRDSPANRLFVFLALVS